MVGSAAVLFIYEIIKTSNTPFPAEWVVSKNSELDICVSYEFIHYRGKEPVLSI
jgi:hypothetical protein